jgi:Uma2 family endonuclease
MNTHETGRLSSKGSPLTVEYLETLPDDNNRYELIAGELIVSHAPSLPHQLVLQRLETAIANYLEQNSIGIVVPGPGVIFSDYDSVIPDLAFVTHEQWDKIVANGRFIAAPNLVVEVLSPGKTNWNRDFELKRRLYAKFAVEEYWIVDTENHQLTVFRLRGQVLEKANTLQNDDKLASPLLPDFELNISSLFVLPRNLS